MHLELLPYLCNRKRNKNKLKPKSRKGSKDMEFTAVYNTKAMKCIEYSFKADSIEQAKAFCRYKFSVKDIVIINHDDETFPIHLGDARKTSAIYRAYIKKHQEL